MFPLCFKLENKYLPIHGKMSKSYNNIIPLLAEEKELRKSVMKIVTNSQEPGEKKDWNDNILFSIENRRLMQKKRSGNETVFIFLFCSKFFWQNCYNAENLQKSEFAVEEENAIVRQKFLPFSRFLGDLKVPQISKNSVFLSYLSHYCKLL